MKRTTIGLLTFFALFLSMPKQASSQTLIELLNGGISELEKLVVNNDENRRILNELVREGKGLRSLAQEGGVQAATKVGQWLGSAHRMASRLTGGKGAIFKAIGKLVEDFVRVFT